MWQNSIFIKCTTLVTQYWLPLTEQALILVKFTIIAIARYQRHNFSSIWLHQSTWLMAQAEFDLLWIIRKTLNKNYEMYDQVLDFCVKGLANKKYNISQYVHHLRHWKMSLVGSVILVVLQWNKDWNIYMHYSNDRQTFKIVCCTKLPQCAQQ